MNENVKDSESPFYDEESKTTRTEKREFNPELYLDTRIPAGKQSRETKIRILPASADTNKISIPLKIHSLNGLSTEIAASGYKAFICLNDPHVDSHDERGCPMCNHSKELFEEAQKYKDGNSEEYRAIIEKAKACEQSNPEGYAKLMKEAEECKKRDEAKYKAICKEAYRYQPKTAYIVRVIERGAEDKGVKFWRFNKWDNGKGCMDQLKNIYNRRRADSLSQLGEDYDVFDLDRGRDIVMTLSKGLNTDRVEVSLQDASFDTKLSNDPEQVKAWVNDPKTWRDAYSVKTYEYLDVVVNGGVPRYDRELGVFVNKYDEKKSETDQGTEKAPSNDSVVVELPF